MADPVWKTNEFSHNHIDFVNIHTHLSTQRYFNTYFWNFWFLFQLSLVMLYFIN